MKKILETLRNKWSEYLIETLVIFLGIFGAFTLNEWKDNREEENNLIAILEKSQISIQQEMGGLKGQVDGYERSLANTLLALQIIEKEEALSAEQDSIVEQALSGALVMGTRIFNIRMLELLSESLPGTEPNLDLIRETDQLIDRITSRTDLINRMHMHLFSKETLLDKNILRFDINANAIFDYKVLKQSPQTIDYLVRSYRWKIWTSNFESEFIKKYEIVGILIEKRIRELED